MAREHRKELLGIVEHQLVEPGAAVRHRVMMQADERMRIRLRRERDVEPREFLGRRSARRANPATVLSSIMISQSS